MFVPHLRQPIRLMIYAPPIHERTRCRASRRAIRELEIHATPNRPRLDDEREQLAALEAFRRRLLGRSPADGAVWSRLGELLAHGLEALRRGVETQSPELDLELPRVRRHRVPRLERAVDMVSPPVPREIVADLGARHPAWRAAKRAQQIIRHGVAERVSKDVSRGVIGVSPNLEPGAQVRLTDRRRVIEQRVHEREPHHLRLSAGCDGAEPGPPFIQRR
jgi:hypothetical protein